MATEVELNNQGSKVVAKNGFPTESSKFDSE